MPVYSNAVSSEKIVLDGLPLPSSSNQQYFVARGRLCPSKSLTQFKRSIDVYALRYSSDIWDARKVVKTWLDHGLRLNVSISYYLHKPRVFTKNGELRKIDVSNLIKPSHDSLSRIIAADDTHFFTVEAEKCICDEKIEERFTAIIRPQI